MIQTTLYYQIIYVALYTDYVNYYKSKILSIKYGAGQKFDASNLQLYS